MTALPTKSDTDKAKTAHTKKTLPKQFFNFLTVPDCFSFWNSYLK